MKVLHDLFVQYLNSISIKSEINVRTNLASAYGRNNACFSWPAEPFASIIAKLREHYPRISEKTLCDLLESAAVELFREAFLNENGSLEAVVEFESLFRELTPEDVVDKAKVLLGKLNTQIKEFVFFIPLRGIKLTIPQFKIAGGILFPKDSDELNKRLEKTNASEYLKQNVVEEYTTSSAYFVCTQDGDIQMAEIHAREQAKIVIQILRFYLTPNTLKYQRKYHQIRLVGEPDSDDIFLFFHELIPDEEEKAEALWNQALGPFRTYELTLEQTKHMNETGLATIQNALLYSESKVQTIQARLQRTIRWFSFAVSAHEIDQKFVGFAVALESLLTNQVKPDPKHSWGGITQNLAERCAFLLSEDYEKRLRIAKDVRELYAMRSSAVHSGHPVSPENVERIQVMTRCVILAFVAKEFGNWDNFTEWIKQCKYGGAEGPRE
jgi:hypothetical protein